MIDARDRAINALCDTIADLRKRIFDLEFVATLPTAFPPGTQFFGDKPPIVPEGHHIRFVNPDGSVVWRNVGAGIVSDAAGRSTTKRQGGPSGA